jgi:hypothetical protein
MSLAKLGLGRNKEFTTNADDIYRWYGPHFVPFFGNPQHLQEIILPAGADAMQVQSLSSETIQSSAVPLADCFSAHEGTWPTVFPNVQFYFFNPPFFQWALWYFQKSGAVAVWNRAGEIISGRLRRSDNARYFDLNADTKITEDCRRYMDTAHHTPETDDEIFNLIHEGKFERTAATNSALSAAVLSSATNKVPCPPAE